MKRIATFAVLAAASFAVPARGQEFDLAPERPAAAAADDSYYYTAPPERTPQPSIAQQKSMVRAQQRMQRLAAMRAWGMSPGRPTATAMAFTTMYSPAWQMPGGRPFAWRHSSYGGMVIYHTVERPVTR